jgi:glycosyltransferase involved in cell wall biosynthesis
MQPAGGTELQLAYLKKYANQGILDSVQITTSIPEKEPLDPIRANILWLKNSYDQPNLAPWFQNKENHSKYDWYVFNSHWSYEKYRMFFGIPEDKCTVIKNGIDYEELQLKTDFTPKKKLKMCYISTPWRGLEVALAAMDSLKDRDPDITLDVYSSTIIYGKQFHNHNDKEYLDLYQKAKDLPNVNYMGYCDHKTLMGKLKEYDVNCFPSIWEETFCISAMESLAAGQLLITTDLGALFETCAEFPIYIPFTRDKAKLAQQVAECCVEAKKILQNDLTNVFKFQQEYYKRFYDWRNTAKNWESFLRGVIHVQRNK